MAFQVGDIKISGTVDGLSFYHSVFGWLVRRKGGPRRRQFKTSPAFARSRENSEEFTACARAASAIRRLVIIHTGEKDKTLYHRLMKLMRLLANEDTQVLRGKRDPLRGILTANGHARVKEFKINGDLCLYDILQQAGFFKEPEDKVTEPKRTPVPSATLRRRQAKRRPVFYHIPQDLPTALPWPPRRTQPQLNTAFG